MFKNGFKFYMGMCAASAVILAIVGICIKIDAIRNKIESRIFGFVKSEEVNEG